MLTFLVWCLLFVLCWPIAIMALILYPMVWLILLPFKLLGGAVAGIFAFFLFFIFLPFYLLKKIVHA